MALSRITIGHFWRMRLVPVLLVFFIIFGLRYYRMFSPEQSVVSKKANATDTMRERGVKTDSESPLDKLGIHPRPFLPWENPLPCFARRKNGNLPTHREGFVFIKIPKTGSSTGSGINLRISTNVARQQHLPERFCENYFQHGTARKVDLKKRIKNKSFAWSIVRDPTTRAISEFFHFRVARNGLTPSDENFVKFLNKAYLRNFQVNYLAFENITDITDSIQSILNGYDFLGSTERLEESAVALQMLLGLETADVMSLSSAKSSGGYDDGGYRHTCFLIPKPVVSPRVQETLQSKHWKEAIYWDEILHHAINQSLDLTIEKLGSSKFQRNLEKYREAKREVADYCRNNVTFPCTSTGVRIENSKTDCIFMDYGCGFNCMNEYFDQQFQDGPS